MSLRSLATLNGVGRVNACVFAAAFELTRRGLKKGIGILPVVYRPNDVSRPYQT